MRILLCLSLHRCPHDSHRLLTLPLSTRTNFFPVLRVSVTEHTPAPGAHTIMHMSVNALATTFYVSSFTNPTGVAAHVTNSGNNGKRDTLQVLLNTTAVHPSLSTTPCVIITKLPQVPTPSTLAHTSLNPIPMSASTHNYFSHCQLNQTNSLFENSPSLTNRFAIDRSHHSTRPPQPSGLDCFHQVPCNVL